MILQRSIRECANRYLAKSGALCGNHRSTELRIFAASLRRRPDVFLLLNREVRMLSRLLFVLLLSASLLACASTTPDPGAAPAPFLVIHQYTPATEAAQQGLLDHVAALNRAIARTGRAKTQVLAWRVTGEQVGPFSHVLGSLWPDEATYDAVREHPEYRAVIQRFEESGAEPFRTRETSEYVLLNPAALPDFDRVEHLRMERAVIASGIEAEQALIGMLEEASEAVARAGHPETRFDLWRRVDDERADTYLLGSLWTSRAAHDAARRHPAYQRVMDRHRDTYESLVESRGLNRYERISL